MARVRALLVSVLLAIGCGSSNEPVAVTPSDAEGDLPTDDPVPECTASLNKGPWVLAIDATHARVRWESCVKAPSAIQLSVEGTAEKTRRPSVVTERVVTTTNLAPLRQDADFPGTYYMNDVALEGLTPGTCYEYVLESDASAKGRFCTARPSGTPFTFVTLGDTNPGFGPTASLLGHVYGVKSDFTVHAGDLHYYSSGLETYQFWFGEMKALFRGGGFFHSIGNHEREQPNEYEEYVDRFWGNAGFDGTHDYFRFESGGVWFFALDTEQDWKLSSKQGTWLAASLDDASKKPGYRFAVLYFHRPWVTCGDKGDSPQSRMEYKDLFDRTKVKLVIQGHMHAYERFELDERVWLTVGGGGGALGNVDENAMRPECASRKSSGKFFHAVRVEVKAAEIAGTTIDDRGATRDAFTFPVP